MLASLHSLLRNPNLRQPPNTCAIKLTLPPACRSSAWQPNEGETTPEALLARLKALSYDNIHTTMIGELVVLLGIMG